ncbi:unnamed protein product [Cochlearia groenlandica]
MIRRFLEIVNGQMQFVLPAAPVKGPSQKLTDAFVNKNCVDVTFEEQDDEVLIAVDVVFTYIQTKQTTTLQGLVCLQTCTLCLLLVHMVMIPHNMTIEMMGVMITLGPMITITIFGRN